GGRWVIENDMGPGLRPAKGLWADGPPPDSFDPAPRAGRCRKPRREAPPRGRGRLGVFYRRGGAPGNAGGLRGYPRPRQRPTLLIGTRPGFDCESHGTDADAPVEPTPCCDR